MTVSSPTSASAFVELHAAEVPVTLIERVKSVLAADAASAKLPVAEALLKTSTTLLSGVLADSDAGREVALDLLAADACVTWAFEAAADLPGTLPEQAERAMQQIAELAK